MATSILQASVYVGTHGKYNGGSIAGKWMRLADYTTKRNFLAACRDLHKDESDPEFMFQDWESIPTSMISESSVDDEIWHVINSIKKFAADMAEDFAEWCEDNGSEQDYNALREFMGYGKGEKKETKPTNSLQASKDILDGIIRSFWTSESDIRYYKGKISNAASFDGKVVVFEKPHMKTSFCFDDEDDTAMQIYHEFGTNSKRAHNYFIRHNLDRCDQLQELAYFLSNDDKNKPYTWTWESTKLYMYKEFANKDVYKIGVFTDSELEDHKRWYKDNEYIQLTDEQEKFYHRLLLNEKDKFEDRMHQYLKRYGVSKCRTWSYWANK